MISEQNESELDSITSMMGRESFYRFGNELLKEAEEKGQLDRYVLVYCNICNFRYYNVKYNKESGDQVLRFLADTISTLGKGSLNARFGSDHFVTLSRKEDVLELVQQGKKTFDGEYASDGMVYKAGIYRFRDGSMNIEKACELAKIACDRIRDKRDFLSIYNKQMGHDIEMAVYILQNLEQALEEKWIHAYYQPVIRTINGYLSSLEALARWIDPKRGMISPADFIPVLEENQLITKLDLYILEEVCQTIKQKLEEGLKAVPVSINLSRFDFLSCDIFQEVENMLKKYSIARDMICIEVTESMVMEDPALFQREIQRFREAGYEVWMDDFGSGYSSLNVLKDYEVDEIKLDMQFLRSFDEKTKHLIRSIISMAKEMKLRTLAEGVETREQYEFLREIGCDKVQGFLFSPPIPLSKVQDMFDHAQDRVESRICRKYYSKVSELNFITDRTMAVLDYDGVNFNYIYTNQAYRDVWKDMGITHIRELYETVNFPSSPLYQRYRNVLGKMQPGDGPVQMEYNFSGCYVRVIAKLLSIEKDNRLITTEIINLTRYDEKTTQDRNNYIFRMMFSMYDSIFLYHLDSGKIEVIKQGTKYSELSSDWKKRDDIPDFPTIAKIMILREDREEFLRFLDPKTIEKQLESAGRESITKMFRTKSANGAYVWMLHTVQLIPGTNLVTYTSRYVPLLREQLLSKKEDLGIDAEKNPIEQEIWKTLLHSQLMNLFWKDTDRRFVGANARFLDSFGLNSLDDILGKTDEDMHWHIDDDPFREDELRVLHEGVPVVSRLGKVIIRGVVHNVIARKEPVYRNGKLIGLVGDYTSIDDLTKYLGMSPILETMDPLSGLMSAQGISNTASDYMEGYEFRHENFAVLSINFDAYRRAEQTYGNLIARKILKEIGALLAEISANDAVAGRIYGGVFLLLMKYEGRQEVEDLMERLQERCATVRELAGYPETLYPKMKAYYAEDHKEDLRAMMRESTSGFDIDFGIQKNFEGQLRDNHIELESLIQRIPGGVALFEIFPEEDIHLLYVSDGLCQTTGYSVAEYKSQTNYEEMFGIISEDSVKTLQKLRETIQKRGFYDTSYRVKRKDGSTIWLKAQGRVISQRNGHPLLMVVYHNLSESNQIFDRIIESTQEGLIVRQLETKTILYANHAIRQLLEVAAPSLSMDEFCGDLIQQHKDGDSFELDYGGHYLRINIMNSLWYGREAEIFYIVDLTLQHQKYLDMQEILSHVPAGLAVFSISKDYDFHRLYLSEQAKIYCHIPESGGSSLDELISVVHPEDREYVQKKVRESVIARELMDIEFRVLGNDGKTYWDRLMTMPYIQPDGSYLLYGVYSDITELKLRRDELELLSLRDGLTGLRNRHALREDFEKMPRHEICMFMMDIDHFKSFNDLFGHEAGDQVIEFCGKSIQKHFPDCYCYRYGGDEFLIISTEQKLSEMKKRVENCIQEIGSARLGEQFPKIEISCGSLEGFAGNREDIRALFKKADNLMYERKAKRHAAALLEAAEKKG